MKHVIAAARYAGIDLDQGQLHRLERYGEWLESEGTTGGGIGPDEAVRIERRHLADSLLFASQFPHDCAEVLDVGSGVGLPGIPLAVVLPGTSFTLIDRSGRRVDLLRRAIRILDLGNCQVVQGEIEAWRRTAPVLVARASLPPDEMRPVAQRLVRPGGVAVLAGSWRERPHYTGWTTIEIPSDVLDQPVWLLIMRRQ
ncbi:MAG: class I SAM-dependent methyltransferase [Acidimicrobiia bacterium]